MKDLKHNGLKPSTMVTQATKLDQRITMAVSCLGSVIGALCVVYITVVLFTTTGA